MGKLKQSAEQTHELTESEYNMLKLMNEALRYNVAGNKIISGFIYYISSSRLGYKDGQDLQFELDFDKDDRLLKITEVTQAK
jgi:hypothetical protein